ncbi:MAG: recombinase family protein [Egibacteraceae bacterium]
MIATDATVRVALYARISKDDRHTEKGVTRQLEDGRKLAADRGWIVAGEYVDNDRSAFNGKERAEWRRLLADAPGLDRVVAWQLDRLWRNSAERVADAETLARARVGLTLTQGGDYDLATAADGLTTGVLGELAAFESRLKGERVSRAARQRAEEGKANTVVLYGWRREREYDQAGRVAAWWDVEEPTEADIVRDVVRRILDGEPITRIAEDLNARGVVPPSRRPDKAWSRSGVRALALRPANAGVRTYKGETFPAAWPALVTAEQHERVCALLARRSSGKGQRPASRKYLLSGGIGECGVCNGPLRGRRKRNPRGQEFELYVCRDRGCVGRNREAVDEWVAAVVTERLARPDAAEVFAPDDEAARAALDRAEGVRARLDNAADAYAEGTIDRDQLARISGKLRPVLDQLEGEARRLSAGANLGVLGPLLADHAGAVWAGLDVARQRRVLEVLGLRVTVMPQRDTAGPRFDRDLVRISWRA